jgi:hypothetical protein
MQKYKGSCHCGKVQYEVELDLATSANMMCNCSRCHRLGWVLTFVPAEQFTLIQGEDNLTDYQFNKQRIHHLFCKTCGIESFARGKGKDDADTVAVNLRCVEGVDLDSLKINKVNGKDF